MSPALEALESPATLLSLEVEQYGGRRGKYLFREMSAILANELDSQIEHLKAHMAECRKILAPFASEIVSAYKPEYQAEVKSTLTIE